VKNNEEAIYRLYSKEVVTKGSNTSNLISHLCVHHLLNYVYCLYLCYIQRKKTETLKEQTAPQIKHEEQDEEVTICSLEQNVAYIRIIYYFTNFIKLSWGFPNIIIIAGVTECIDTILLFLLCMQEACLL